jgi:hypothetical protein
MPHPAATHIVPKPLQPYTLPFYRLTRRLKTALLRATCRVNPNPILVLGNQKSGTTAIAALLGELAKSSVTLDLTREIAEPTYPRLRKGELTLEQFIRRNKLDFSRRIVKEPHLTPFYAELKDRFPESPFVFVVRDPRDNLRSILNRLQLPGDRVRLTEQDLADVGAAWRLVLDNRWLDVGGDHYVEQLAGRWLLLAQVYLAHAKEMILVRYEDFLLDKIGTIQRLAGQVDLETRADISGSVERQFQPRGDHSVSWSEFFGQQNLVRIEQLCQPGMREFGYRTADSGWLEQR